MSKDSLALSPFLTVSSGLVQQSTLFGEDGEDESSPVDMGSGVDPLDDTREDDEHAENTEEADEDFLACEEGALLRCAGRETNEGFFSGRDTATPDAVVLSLASKWGNRSAAAAGAAMTPPVGALSMDMSMLPLEEEQDETEEEEEDAASAATAAAATDVAGVGTLR